VADREADTADAAPAAAAEATERHARIVQLPVLGAFTIPSPPHLAWYVGVAVLAASGMIELPVALVLAVGKALSDNHSDRTLQDFGSALEEAV
jgi:hypothetical protein